MTEDLNCLEGRIGDHRKALGYCVVSMVCVFFSGIAMLVGDNLPRPLSIIGISLSGIMFGFLIWRIKALVGTINALEAMVQLLGETGDLSVSDLIVDKDC